MNPTNMPPAQVPSNVPQAPNAPQAPHRLVKAAQPVPYWHVLRRHCRPAIAYYTPEDILELEDRTVLKKLYNFYYCPSAYVGPLAPPAETLYCNLLCLCIFNRLLNM